MYVSHRFLKYLGKYCSLAGAVQSFWLEKADRIPDCEDISFQVKK
jgi:hypothetical protein